MQCTVLVPQLFWPRESADEIERDLDLPALRKLLARSRAERSAPLTLEAWLCQAFEVEKQQDWPVAPLTLELDGGGAGKDYWLRADPVHVKLQRDRLLLVDAALFDITTEEAQAFAHVLNRHFEADDIVFEPRSPKRWYVRLGNPPMLTTHQPDDAAGHEIRDFLPRGDDAIKWHRVFNEAQMLLHEHPLNDAREARGEPPVNSVWFWGGGTRPRVHGRHYTHVWGDDALAAALATAADAQARSNPRDAGGWLAASAGSGRGASHLVILKELATATRYGDASAWRTRASAFDRDWLRPLISALKDGRLGRLVLAAPGGSGSWRFEAARGDLMKFWRPAKALSAYA